MIGRGGVGVLLWGNVNIQLDKNDHNAAQHCFIERNRGNKRLGGGAVGGPVGNAAVCAAICVVLSSSTYAGSNPILRLTVQQHKFLELCLLYFRNQH